MTDKTLENMSEVDVEQTVLNLNAKAMLTLAVFIGANLLERMLIDPAFVVSVMISATQLITIVCCVVITLRFSKLSKKLSAKSYWTMQYKDEYVDYVSGVSQRFAFQFLLLGVLIVSLIGGDGGLILTGAFSEFELLEVWTILSLFLYSGIILYMFRGESEDE